MIWYRTTVEGMEGGGALLRGSSSADSQYVVSSVSFWAALFCVYNTLRSASFDHTRNAVLQWPASVLIAAAWDVVLEEAAAEKPSPVPWKCLASSSFRAWIRYW